MLKYAKHCPCISKKRCHRHVVLIIHLKGSLSEDLWATEQFPRRVATCFQPMKHEEVRQFRVSVTSFITSSDSLKWKFLFKTDEAVRLFYSKN